MKYVIEDTYNGFRLSMLDSQTKVVRHHYDEEGGHGPLENLYARAEVAWVKLRAQEIRAAKAMGNPEKPAA